MKQLAVGIVGMGSFADCFIPLFKAHPLVKELVLCDLDSAKLQKKAKRFGVEETSPSLNHLCGTDVDAIVIITQNWMHGPQAVQALFAGKHVYSAVPSAITLDEITALVRTVEETGRIYMVGETSYYYPTAIYCRERFQRGDFGDIVYGEGEYYHDFDLGLYSVFQERGGAEWKKIAGSPPMHYPTHSTSMIVSVTGAHMTHVSCMGWVDRHEDGLFREGVNRWNNIFSNQTALFRMSDGGMARINEFRRIGHPGGECVSLYGTKASFEEQTGSQVFVTKNRNEMVDLTTTLACAEIPTHEVGGMSMLPKSDAVYNGVSAVHPVARLPKEFKGLTNGHNGSHQFLVDDFVKACIHGQQPPNNVWQAARYLVPGLVAHESALQGGVLLEVPDLGAAPY